MTEKKVNKAWKPIAVIVSVLLIFSICAFALKSGGISLEEHNQDIEMAKLQAKQETETAKNAEINKLQEKVQNLTEELIVATAIPIESEETSEDSIIDSLKHLIEDIFLGEDTVDETLSDRELDLFDGKVTFDDEEYDAEETLEVSGLVLLANEEDMFGVPFLTFGEDSMIYKFKVEDDLNTSLIDEDETLSINLLGKEVEISDWTADSVTFTEGDEFSMDEGVENQKIIGEDTVLVKGIYSDKVIIVVNGVEKSIKEGETVKFGNLEIYVSDFEAKKYAGATSYVTMKIGTDVENIVEDEDEYEDESIWEWVITDHSIGLRLVEDFTELDEDNKPLATGEKLCLPNDYKCFVFDGVLDTDKFTYKLDLEDNFVRVKGDFDVGTKDYEVVYINSSDGKFYEDDNDEDEIVGTVNLGSSDYELTTNGSTNFEIAKVIFNYSLSNVECSTEDDYMTDEGVLIYDPENSCDDQEYKIEVPEEKTEATVTVY